MKTRKVLSHQADKAWPMDGAAYFIAVWLLLDRLGAAGWWYGVFWTLVAIRLALNIFLFATQEEWIPSWSHREPAA